MLNLATQADSGATAYAVIAVVARNAETLAAEYQLYDTVNGNFVSTGFTGDAGTSGFNVDNCVYYFTEAMGASGTYYLQANPAINGTYDAVAYQMVGAAPNLNVDRAIGHAEIYYEYAEDDGTIEGGGVDRRPVATTISTSQQLIDLLAAGALTPLQQRQLSSIYNRVLRDNTSSGL
jgi:hypothetical protein